jgi:hypothetical protein
MSDNDNSQISEASDDAQTPAADAAGTYTQEQYDEVISRAQRMTSQRRDIGAKYDAALQRITELEAKANPGAYDGTKDAPAPEKPDDVPPWATALASEVSSLKESIAGDKKNRAVESAHAKILKDIPDGNKEQARLMLDGMAANGLDFTSDGAVDTALKQLQTTNVMFDPDRRSPARGRPLGPDEKPDFSGFNSWDDIPINHRSRVPDDVAARLSGRGTAGKRTDGHLI